MQQQNPYNHPQMQQEQGMMPPQVAEPRLERMICNLISVPQLNITREMFFEHTLIEGGTLMEAMK